jgi:cell division protein ZapE
LLADRYATVLHAGSHAPDAAQQVVIQRLSILEQCLRAQRVAAFPRRWLAALRRDRRYAGQCRGVYLWGPVGRGKSWMMDLLLAGFAPRQARRVHFQHFMRDIHAHLARTRRQLRPLDIVAAQLARQSRLLCVDEFQVQDIGDAMILHAVLDGLLQRGVVLVMTSNTAPQRLYEGGLQRERFLPAIALLQAHLDVLDIGAGIDYRLRALQAAPNYLDRASPHSHSQMQERFAQLAGGAPESRSHTLLIEGRRIPVVRSAAGIVWFEFAALCEGARSAQDYIAIADESHTVLVSGVPVFNGDNDDAARRFIALIDELYDRSVKLVVSAAAEPPALYRGERLRGDFARTASRLIEMRSAEYLARPRFHYDTAASRHSVESTA